MNSFEEIRICGTNVIIRYGRVGDVCGENVDKSTEFAVHESLGFDDSREEECTSWHEGGVREILLSGDDLGADPSLLSGSGGDPRSGRGFCNGGVDVDLFAGDGDRSITLFFRDKDVVNCDVCAVIALTYGVFKYRA